MKSPKNALILLLAATTVGGAILAWRQHNELGEFRAAAMNRSERADLQKRAWELEKLNRELRDQLAVRTPGGATGGELTKSEGERPGREANLRGLGRGGLFDKVRDAEQQYIAMRELTNRPEVQAMINQQVRGGIETRYAALFKNLNLAPDQTEKLKGLLAERTTTMQDIMSVAFDQGVNPRENPEAFRKLVADAQNEINKSIRSVIGDQGFAQLSNFEQTQPQRNLVNELQQRLSYTSTPLTGSQADQLVQILATNPPQRQPGSPGDPAPGPRPPPPGGPDIGGIIASVVGGGIGPGTGSPDGRGGGPATIVTSAAVSQSQTVLSPPQVAALQQIQQQQQTQQQLRQLVNDTLSASRPVPGGGAPGSAPGGPPPGTGTGGGTKVGPGRGG